ncbi:MAG: hypothetical protein ABGW81_05400 [Paracoccaceae bacterium]
MDTNSHTYLFTMYTGIVGNTLRTSLLGLLGTMAIIAFADISDYKLAMAAIIITFTVLGVLRAKGPIGSLGPLSTDMSSELAESNYGKALADAPFGMFKIVTSVLFLATGLAQLWALW